ncbi:hypothetical protein CLU79DRAFT_773202 [Phycomyces nitens]|nr:hypothetical protein CLU79DRAFT_773202 [Phycomyces nitens]
MGVSWRKLWWVGSCLLWWIRPSLLRWVRPRLGWRHWTCRRRIGLGGRWSWVERLQKKGRGRYVWRRFGRISYATRTLRGKSLAMRWGTIWWRTI